MVMTSPNPCGLVHSALAGLALVAAPLAAQAADMPVKAVKAVYAAHNWTGFYVGANAGYSWGPWDSTGFLPGATVLPPPGPGGGSASPKVQGWLAGLQAGYNWQINNTVVGIEGDFQITGQRATLDWTTPPFGVVAVFPGFPVTNEWKFPWFATLRGRIGYAKDTWLFYLTGGGAYGKAESTLTLPVLTLSDSKTKFGWTIGAGVEAALGRNWSAKLEYLYLDLGSVTFFETSGTPVTSKITDHIVRVGLNYRFAPVVARW
jgi:outer membrane immunogenic protein